MTKNDDPQTSLTLVVGVIGAILVFVAIVALQALFYKVEEGELYNKVYTARPEELTRLVAEQQERLHQYGWVDQKKGIARIPIERAIELIVQEQAKGE